MRSDFYQVKVGGQCHFTRLIDGHNTVIGAIFVN